MLRALNVKMLNLTNEQKNIRPFNTINEFVSYRYYFNSSLLY
jgi:hypothetical protein